MHEDAHKLIPELQQWNDGQGISLEAWTSCVGSYDLAIGYATLFWPDFVLYDDCVFFKEPDAAEYKDWMAHCRGDKQSVEKVMNHHHLMDLFRNSQFSPTKEILVHIGKLLRDVWQCKLKRDFPDRQIRVEFYDDATDDLVRYEITVFHERR